jgi:biopolymer transport protein ExbD
MAMNNQINMTPMIDILLVPLIIFMAISPQTPHGLGALVPQSDAGAGPGRGRIPWRLRLPRMARIG